MSRLRFKISMSLDGFVAGPSQSVDNPLGIGGTRLHEWAFALAVARAARPRSWRGQRQHPGRRGIACQHRSHQLGELQSEERIRDGARTVLHPILSERSCVGAIR